MYIKFGDNFVKKGASNDVNSSFMRP